MDSYAGQEAIVRTLYITISSVQSLSHVRLFVTPWIATHQASLSITNSRSSLRLTSIKSVMPSSHLILCHPLLFLPSIPPSIRVFSNESTLRMRWPKYWSFSFSIIMDWFKIGKGVQQSCTLFACLTYMQSTSCNNIQKNCTKKVFTTQIIMVWSLI